MRSKVYGEGVTVSTQAGLSIQEAAGRLGASVHTLRYYEREGLLTVPRLGAGGPPPPGPGGHHAQRRYGEAEMELLRFLLALRATGMPISLIRRYMALVRQGDGTTGERRALLVEHQRAVTAQIALLQDNLQAIELKIGKYDRSAGWAGEPCATPGGTPDGQDQIGKSGVTGQPAGAGLHGHERVLRAE